MFPYFSVSRCRGAMPEARKFRNSLLLLKIIMEKGNQFFLPVHLGVLYLNFTTLNIIRSFSILFPV